MDTYRVGVIADTHVPKSLPVLPEEISKLFQGVDLILHAGDITSKEVLDELRLVAPVVAVGETMTGWICQLALLLRLAANVSGLLMGIDQSGKSCRVLFPMRCLMGGLSGGVDFKDRYCALSRM